MAETIGHGWLRLPSGFDVQFEHGIPVRVSNHSLPIPRDTAALAQEIADASGLRVRIGAWGPGEGPGEQEAPLTVDAEDLDRVLQRLAKVSAGLFYDRFGKALDDDDPDWDTESYAQDFAAALRYCGLSWDQADKEAHWPGYRSAMHEETARLTELGEVSTPPE